MRGVSLSSHCTMVLHLLWEHHILPDGDLELFKRTSRVLFHRFPRDEPVFGHVSKRNKL